jgi:Phosphoinositide 3-kinase C2
VPDAVLIAALGSYVSLQVISEGVALHTVAKSTRLPEFQPPWLSFEEWITLPVKIRDLSPTSQLVSPPKVVRKVTVLITFVLRVVFRPFSCMVLMTTSLIRKLCAFLIGNCD